MADDLLRNWTVQDVADPVQLAARLNELTSLLASTDKTLVGAKGEKGDTGHAGADGPPGPQGEQGARGDRGDVGPRGHAGPKGETGQASTEKGPKGDRGEKGERGDRGEKGDIGLRGPYVTFDGRVLPTSPGKPGELWNDQGTVKISG